MPVHYVVVEGLELPAKLGGHPALDFCNTLAGWDGPAPWDYLQSYDHLATWAGFVGLLPPERIGSLRRLAGRRRHDATTVLTEARDLRASVYEVLRDGPATPAFARVAHDVHAAGARLRLRPVAEDIEWEIERETGLAAPVVAVAWSAGQLLASPDRRRVRACPGADCGWLFLDLRGRRRWCTMATCGNRAKARRFAARERARAPG
jgi:predicted RNA-binding Zn ribbon-like protein